MYKQTLSEKAALEPEQLASSVINCKISGEKIWYQKNDLGLSSGDLYEYYNGETDKLETKISSFNTFGKDEIVFFKNYAGMTPLQLIDHGTSMIAVGNGLDHRLDLQVAAVK